MANIDPYLRAVSIGWKVREITGERSAAFKAGGAAAWIESITGSPPLMEELPDGRVKLYLTVEQRDSMSDWLDLQVKKSFTRGKAQPNVEVELGPVFIPWALKFAIPAFAGAFIAGYLTHVVLS